MKQIAIFTEGQSELIFVHNLLLRTFNVEEVGLECIKLIADKTQSVPYTHKPPDPKIYFLIVNVENDSRVLSAIREREQGLLQRGYEEILGLRDMYSEEYRSRSTIIDDNITNTIIRLHKEIIQEMSEPEKISIFFAIMELESWLLSMYGLFAKIHAELTTEFIADNLGINLVEAIPEKEFFHPTIEMIRILDLVGINYDKSEHQMRSIVSKIEDEDIMIAMENGRCASFSEFWEKIGGFDIQH